MVKPDTLTLPGGGTVPAVEVSPRGDLGGLAEALGLGPLQGAIALVGGAKGFDEEASAALREGVERILTELADVATAQKLAVVDGGTPSGIMRMMGEIRAAGNRQFPLIGVSPSGKVTWTDRPLSEGGKTPLDDEHSAFVLVDSAVWGGEAEALAAVAHALAGDNPALEVLVNGGEVARHDVWHFLKHGGQLVVVEGSGRFADELAAALRQGKAKPITLRRIIKTGQAHVFPLDSPPGAFAAELKRLGGW